MSDGSLSGVTPRDAAAESRELCDYLRLLRTIPAVQAFRPLAESICAQARAG